MTPRRRAIGDRGTGLVSTVAGLLAFLAFLLFAVQLLLNLYAASTLTAAAGDAARLVAARGAARDPAGLARAEAYARGLLGRFGDDATFTWEVDADSVRLRVQADPPRVLLPVLGGALGFDHIDRTVEARIEELR
jgi:Flp pilus assembly protein TadG